MKRITIQGQPGCFHETAARCSFPGEQVEILPCDSFDQQFARMAADPTLLGIAAIENTIAGSLLPNHELLRRSSLAVIGEYKLRISHVLAALPGEAPCDIGEVHSHPIALMQCGDYLKGHPAMKVVERDDTAGSAREIAEQRLAARPPSAAPGRRSSTGSKSWNGASRPTNTTSRASSCWPTAAAPQGSPTRPARTRHRWSSRCPHQGSLSKVLSLLSFYEINSRKYSRCDHRPRVGIRFYVDVTFDDRCVTGKPSKRRGR